MVFAGDEAEGREAMVLGAEVTVVGFVETRKRMNQGWDR